MSDEKDPHEGQVCVETVSKVKLLRVRSRRGESLGCYAVGFVDRDMGTSTMRASFRCPDEGLAKSSDHALGLARECVRTLLGTTVTVSDIETKWLKPKGQGLADGERVMLTTSRQMERMWVDPAEFPDLAGTDLGLQAGDGAKRVPKDDLGAQTT